MRKFIVHVIALVFCNLLLMQHAVARHATVGGKGNDVLVAKQGGDVLFGGAGSDHFYINFEPGHPDVIKDFSVEENDHLTLKFQVNERSRFRVPSKLTINNVEIDRKGNMSIRLLGDEKVNFLKMNTNLLLLEIDDKGDTVNFRFKTRF